MGNQTAPVSARAAGRLVKLWLIAKGLFGTLLKPMTSFYHASPPSANLQT